MTVITRAGKGSALTHNEMDANFTGLDLDGNVTAQGLFEALSIIGQVSGQINGGRATLAAGTLADPALRIGTIGIYSAADNTLSVAVAGVERLRITASGITVYGTVTTVP